jgi:mycofactocin precursor
MNPEQKPTDEQDVVSSEDLIEEVSIDGMCGVY